MDSSPDRIIRAAERPIWKKSVDKPASGNKEKILLTNGIRYFLEYFNAKRMLSSELSDSLCNKVTI